MALTARLIYIGLALGTISLGLLVHSHGDVFTPPSRDVLGDIIWAGMIAWWVGAIAPRASLRVRSAAAVAICFAVEASQLYHTPTFDMIRNTTMGQLILGSGFDPRDLAAYFVGVMTAALIERLSRLSVSRQHQGSRG